MGGSMIRRDFAFIDLVNSQNISKLKIDKALLPFFVSTMQRMQAYFSKKGYMKANNYAMLFQKYLLTPGPHQFTIRLGKLSDATAGIYNRQNKEIVINKQQFAKYYKFKRRYIESIICHEFIHFLAKTDYPFVEQADGTFKQESKKYFDSAFFYNPFIIEAYTEALVRRIYPNSSAYEPHVRMIDFANYIFDADNNFFAFLRGQMPAYNRKIKKFKNLVAEYVYNVGGDFSMITANKSKNYMAAQRLLLDLFKKNVSKEIDNFKLHNIYDYVMRVSKLESLQPIKTPTESKYMLYDLHTKFIDKYLSFNKGIDKHQKVVLTNMLAEYCECVRQHEAKIAESILVTDYPFYAAIDVERNNVILSLADQKISLSKFREKEYEGTVKYLKGKKTREMPFKVTVKDDKLNLQIGSPVIINTTINISESKYERLMTQKRNKIASFYTTFTNLHEDKYESITQLFKKDRRISSVQSVVFPDLMGNPDFWFKVYITQDVYKQRKLWYVEDNQVKNFDLENLFNPLLKEKMKKITISSYNFSKKQIERKEFEGFEIKAENSRLFLYVSDNKPCIANIRPEGGFSYPIEHAVSYEIDREDMFTKVVLKNQKDFAFN